MSSSRPVRLTTTAAPMLVWALHFVTVYSLQGVACARGVWRTRVDGLETVTWTLSATTVLALAAIAWLGVRSLRTWRRAGAGPHPDVAVQRLRFFSGLGALLAVLAAIATVFTFVPILLLSTCQ